MTVPHSLSGAAIHLAPSEAIREIPGFPDYFVSSIGRVFDAKGQERRIRKNRDGYPIVDIAFGPCRWARRWRQRRVHQLVLEAFVGPRPPGHVGRHLNDVRDDNRLENLRWGTPRENTEDYRRNNGLAPLPPLRVRPSMRGEAHPQAKLTAAMVREIRDTHVPHSAETGFSAFARRFGVTGTAVRAAFHGDNWRYLVPTTQSQSQLAA